MNKSETRQTNIVVDFLAYLADKESEEATQELLDIPGFMESFYRGKKDIAEGRVTSWEQLKRKYYSSSRINEVHP